MGQLVVAVSTVRHNQSRLHIPLIFLFFSFKIDVSTLYHSSDPGTEGEHVAHYLLLIWCNQMALDYLQGTQHLALVYLWWWQIRHAAVVPRLGLGSKARVSKHRMFGGWSQASGIPKALNETFGSTLSWFTSYKHPWTVCMRWCWCWFACWSPSADLHAELKTNWANWHGCKKALLSVLPSC